MFVRQRERQRYRFEIRANRVRRSVSVQRESDRGCYCLLEVGHVS